MTAASVTGDAGMPAVTAYALRLLDDANDLISIDPQEIEDARNWLVNYNPDARAAVAPTKFTVR